MQDLDGMGNIPPLPLTKQKTMARVIVQKARGKAPLPG